MKKKARNNKERRISLVEISFFLSLLKYIREEKVDKISIENSIPRECSVI
jgi:hypothetical protein